MQRADRGVRVPGAAGAVPGEDVGQALSVVRKMFQRHGAILDEGHGLTVALHRHHDVETGLADFPEGRLRTGLGHLDHAAGQAEIGHQFDQPRKITELILALLARELDQQDRVGSADPPTVDEGPFDDRPERRIGARQLDHGAVDQFDGGGLQLHDVLGAVHRLVEAREVHHAQSLVPGQRREFQRESLRHRQRAFAADQQMRQVHRIVGGVGPLRLREEDVEIVATDPAQHLGVLRLDLGLLGKGQRRHLVGDGAHRRRHILGPRRAEARPLAIRQDGVDRGHVVDHVAVADGAAAAGIVAGHAAKRALRRGRHVDRIPEAVRPEPGVELVEDDAGLDRHLGAVLVEAHDLAQMLRDIDDQRLAHRLAALRGAGTAWHDGGPGVARHVDHQRQVGLVARHDDAHRFDLVDRRVGRVAPARGPVEQDLALDGAAQCLFKLGQSSFTPAAATTFCHFSISVRMRLAKSAGFSPPICAV